MRRTWTIIVLGIFAAVPAVLHGADLAPRLIGSEDSPAALSPPEPPPENAIVPLPEGATAGRRATRPNANKVQQVGWQSAWTRVQTTINAPAGRHRPRK